MKIRNARFDRLRIPLVSKFCHATSDRYCNDSIVVRLESTGGDVGYGEAVVRSYMTGETPESCLRYMASILWPALSGAKIPTFEQGRTGVAALAPVAALLPDNPVTAIIAPNGARAAFECALIDMMLRRAGIGIGDVISPHREAVIYSGVIGIGSVESNVKLARRLVNNGIRQIKCKVGRYDDAVRLSAIREAVGPNVSLRVDANGTFNFADAAGRIAHLADFGIACVEQPLPRADVAEMTRLQREVEVPLMADESLVTVDDAKRLIDAGACEYFNLHVAKLGGLGRMLEIAALANDAGIHLQVGCQVGETSILSALGRFVAAHLPAVVFVEGSFGLNLLSADICRPSLEFGTGGIAPVLTGAGNGIAVDDRLVRRFSIESITCGEV